MITLVSDKATDGRSSGAISCYIRPLILNVYRDVGEKNKAGKEVAGCLWRELASIVSSYC